MCLVPPFVLLQGCGMCSDTSARVAGDTPDPVCLPRSRLPAALPSACRAGHALASWVLFMKSAVLGVPFSLSPCFWGPHRISGLTGVGLCPWPSETLWLRGKDSARIVLCSVGRWSGHLRGDRAGIPPHWTAPSTCPDSLGSKAVERRVKLGWREGGGALASVINTLRAG